MPGREGRILRGVAGVYLIAERDGSLIGQAVPRGVFRKQGHRPLPGDFVRVEASGDPDIPWRITEILPRKNELIRPPLANLDLLILTASAELPEIDYNYLDRMLAAAIKNHSSVLFVLTKCDLPGTEEQRETFVNCYRSAGFEVFTAAFGDEESLRQLRERLRGKFAAFAGQSGVGKSSLMNRILGEERLQTGTLSEKAGRGRQTTRSVEIYQRGDILIADTPGFQNLDLERLELRGEDLLEAYPQLKEIASCCRFHNCRHLGEAGCAVESAQISRERLERYRELRRSLDESQRY